MKKKMEKDNMKDRKEYQKQYQKTMQRVEKKVKRLNATIKSISLKYAKNLKINVKICKLINNTLHLPK